MDSAELWWEVDQIDPLLERFAQKSGYQLWPLNPATNLPRKRLLARSEVDRSIHLRMVTSDLVPTEPSRTRWEVLAAASLHECGVWYSLSQTIVTEIGLAELPEVLERYLEEAAVIAIKWSREELLKRGAPNAGGDGLADK